MTGVDVPAPRRVALEDMPGLVGQSLGPTAPVTVSQQQVDQFAAVTSDRQWLHVDAERAAAGPFGGTIVHGYLTLGLSTTMLWRLLEVPDAAQVVNYGLNKVRFPAPLRVGSPVQFNMRIPAVDAVAGGYQLTCAGSFTVPGQDKPVCVMEGLFRYYRGALS